MMAREISKRFIEVLPYNNLWAKQFEQEAYAVKEALGTNCIEIHHIGSTAVPGLAAKPIIDMIPVVSDMMQVDAVNPWGVLNAFPAFFSKRWYPTKVPCPRV